MYQVACQNGHPAAAELLLARGAAPDLCTEAKTTPLRAACLKGHLGVARMLLNAGAVLHRAGTRPLRRVRHAAVAELLATRLRLAVRLHVIGPQRRGRRLEDLVPAVASFLAPRVAPPPPGASSAASSASNDSS